MQIMNGLGLTGHRATSTLARRCLNELGNGGRAGMERPSQMARSATGGFDVQATRLRRRFPSTSFGSAGYGGPANASAVR
jgi:hypothetical protein